MNKLKNNSKVILAFTVIVVMMSVIVGGTFAWISHSNNINGNIATAGSIKISAEITASNATVGTSSSATAIIDPTTGKLAIKEFIPGDKVELTMTVTNIGNNPALITSTIKATDTLNTLIPALNINSKVGTVNTVLQLTSGQACSLGATARLEPNGIIEYVISIEFKTDVSKVDANDSLSFDLVAFGTQINI